MRRFLLNSALTLACVAAFGQGGQGGRGQGTENYDRSVQGIDNTINSYLNSEEIKNIMTPGEFSEWPVTLKAGQVVIADARSDAFDPALEIAQGKDTVLANNDDRYPGDQRPLLLWRCTVDGDYSIRARCFQNKAGGQFFLRYVIYDSMDLSDDKATDREFTKPTAFLLRVPMKAGQIKQVRMEVPDRNFSGIGIGRAISPIGLPDIGLGAALHPVLPNSFMAPVDGDYYVIAKAPGKARVRLRTDLIKVHDLADTAKAPTNGPTLWSRTIKKGEFLEVSTPELSLASGFILVEQAEYEKFDMKKDTTNPFFPQVKSEEDAPKGLAFAYFPSRARDPRTTVILAIRDAKLWVASNGIGPKDSHYTMNVRPAAKPFVESNQIDGKLRIGSYDYWAFDTKVGDVMTFKFGAQGFAERVQIRNPDIADVWISEAAPDQMSSTWTTIVTRPGRYLVAISCLGDGGGGDYSLSRQVFPAKEFSKAAPATGEISDGQVQVWKFTAMPNEPLLIHWKSTSWNFSTQIHTDEGHPTGLPFTTVDPNNQFGILKVDKPTTYLIVLIGNGPKSQYSIELADLPGYGKGGGER